MISSEVTKDVGPVQVVEIGPKPTKEEMQKYLAEMQNDIQRRITACSAAINEALKTHRCMLVFNANIKANQVVDHAYQIIPLE